MCGDSSERGEGRSTIRSQQRERERARVGGREECGQLVCVCQCNTEGLQYWTTHTHIHTHCDERTIYLDQQSVCSDRGRQQEAHWLTSQLLLGQKLQIMWP